MALGRIINLLAEGYPFAKLQASLKLSTPTPLAILAATGSHPFVIGAISRLESKSKLNVIVCATGREAEDYAAFLAQLDDSAEVIEFPSWETLPHERLSPSREIVGRRLKAMHRVSNLAGSQIDHSVYLVVSIRALLQPVVKTVVDHPPFSLHKNHEYSLAELILKLIEMAYERVDMVSTRGEFAVRGGIVDIFPTTAEHAHRLEFFGDELEEIREFSVSDQRSLNTKPDSIELFAARELLITPEVASRAREMVHEFPNLSEMLEKISNAIPVDGMESLAPALTSQLVSLTELLPANSNLIFSNPEKIMARAKNLLETNEEFLHAAWDAAIEGAQAPIDLSAGGFLEFAELCSQAIRAGHKLIEISPFAADDDVVNLEIQDIPSFHQSETDVQEWLVDQVGAGLRVVVSAAGHGTAERIVEILASQNAVLVEDLDNLGEGISVIQASIPSGFVSHKSQLLVITDSEFFGKSASYLAPQKRKLASRRGPAVDPLELKSGDYIVHEIHGVGRFSELVQRTNKVLGRTTTREYLVIQYASPKRGFPADTLFIPTDQLDLLTRYVGADAPVLSKMGGTDWARVKGNARKAVRVIAIDLVKLYSARMKSKGHAFGPDTAWQHELEEAFPFLETPDQLTTIDEIKRDMEREMPMDRLLAGDVGYGKTEVAVRAAFKAIQEGKQVALLCPTTLLVRQHTETFRDRFSGFPVQLRSLSRFQTDKDVKQTLKDLESGAVDMVIGTHRLLSGNVKFRDLGLVIIDEEQRFGVEHKEKLKDLKHNVDVLSMSATPIPRTLEMAVTGIREMSTLATPPEERQPILTYVGGYSEKQVAAAIRRELIREGQVFFVHNRVSTIDAVANNLAQLVPEARIGIAHGQMPEGQLEQVVIDFWERKFDVLVSTTIIETGIDIPNANTLIVDRAERFGLSQLHQIRGRVGRSRDRAYAYFFYDPSLPLSETAHDRLATIATNNALGSGFQVAMKDLEIRGAGNLLGGEQSGHIAGVGFDLYLRMIGEAVAEFKGEKIESPAELKLELPIDAHIPQAYLDSERLRLEAYHKLSATSGAKNTSLELMEIFKELEDRYGPAPLQVKNLIKITELRQLANRLQLRDVNLLGLQFKVQPLQLTESQVVALSHKYPGSRYLQSSKLFSCLSPIGEKGLHDDVEVIDWVQNFLIHDVGSLQHDQTSETD